ncbi:MAG: FHA domain-containing protein [Gammaproteobacteria bacterium]
MGKRTYLIGRQGNVRLNDETVSRRHARLEVEGETLYLRDLDSRNGTYEVRDTELVPFTAGIVSRTQVFAFGECVRTVAQLINTAELEAAIANARPPEELEAESRQFETTTTGSLVEPHKRLSPSDIIQMLERAEDEQAAGRELAAVCTELGITMQRYERWCREYGETRRVREQCVAALRRENEQLKALVRKLKARVKALEGGEAAASNDGGVADVTELRSLEDAQQAG